MFIFIDMETIFMTLGNPFNIVFACFSLSYFFVKIAQECCEKLWSRLALFSEDQKMKQVSKQLTLNGTSLINEMH